jgi:hypothetical protein
MAGGMDHRWILRCTNEVQLVNNRRYLSGEAIASWQPAVVWYD